MIYRYVNNIFIRPRRRNNRASGCLGTSGRRNPRVKSTSVHATCPSKSVFFFGKNKKARDAMTWEARGGARTMRNLAELCPPLRLVLWRIFTNLQVRTFLFHSTRHCCLICFPFNGMWSYFCATSVYLLLFSVAFEIETHGQVKSCLTIRPKIWVDN